MSHEYSDIAKMRASTELPANETQRPELAPGVQHTIGTVAITEADGTAPKHYVQDALDVGLKPPLFPAPEASESLRQQNSRSAVEQCHPADMEQEI